MFPFSCSEFWFDSRFLLAHVVKPASLARSTPCLGSWSPDVHCSHLLHRLGRGGCQCWGKVSVCCSLLPPLLVVVSPPRLELSCLNAHPSCRDSGALTNATVSQTGPMAAASLPGGCSKGALTQNDFWKQLLIVSLVNWAWRLTGRVLSFSFVPEKHQLTAPFPDRKKLDLLLRNQAETNFIFELASAMKSNVASYLLMAKRSWPLFHQCL